MTGTRGPGIHPLEEAAPRCPGALCWGPLPRMSPLSPSRTSGQRLCLYTAQSVPPSLSTLLDHVYLADPTEPDSRL